jgi:hypothetical protein
MKKVKKIIVLMYFVCMGNFAIAQQDLKAEINQTAFDKILSSVNYPYTMFERTYPFKSVSDNPSHTETVEGEIATRILSKDTATIYFQWAVENGRGIQSSSATAIDNEFKEALLMEWEFMKAGIRQILDEHNRNRTTPGYRFTLQGYTPEELEKIQKASVKETIDFFSQRDATAFAMKVHLAFLRVNLNERPTVKVAGPEFEIAGVKVEPTATGELWIKLPVFRCCPPRISWKWKRTVSVTISPDIAANAKVTFGQSNLKVVGRANFTMLRLDYPIFRHIKLENIANRSLKGRVFELYDASLFMASLPYINSRFRIKSISLPHNPNGLTIGVDVVETQTAIPTAGTN